MTGRALLAHNRKSLLTMRADWPPAALFDAAPDLSGFCHTLDSVPAAACVCNRDGLIAYCNRRAVAIWGRELRLFDPADRYCGSSRMFTGSGEPLAPENCWMARALREEREFKNCEIVIEQPSGRRITALAHANPVHDMQGRLLGAVSVLVDITDQRRSEQNNNSLLAALGHELRNPLSSVANAVQVLKRAGISAEQRAWAQDLIERQVDDLASMIDMIADVARLARTDPKPNWAPVRIATVVDDAAEHTRPVVARKDQTCTTSCMPFDLVVLGDEPRLKKTFAALIRCAASVLPAKAVIAVTARDHSDGCTVCVCTPLPPDCSNWSAQALDEYLDTGVCHGESSMGLTLAARVAESHGGALAVRTRGGPDIIYELTIPRGTAGCS